MLAAKKVIWAVLIAGLAALPAMADAIIWNNGVPGSFLAYPSDADIPFQVADNFNLTAADNVITGINWWGVYSNGDVPIPSNDSFTIYLYAWSPGGPSPVSYMSIVADNPYRVDTGQTMRPSVNSYSNVFSYSIATAPLTLNAGQTYLISIVNDTASDPVHDWYWTGSSCVPRGYIRGRETVDSGAWSIWGGHDSVELSFNLIGPTDGGFVRGPGGDGVVPEPASALLLGCGLVGFAARRFRRR